MRAMLFALVLSFGLSASAQTLEAHCGDAIVSTNPKAQIAWTTLHSFHYVHHALEQVKAELPNATYCISGMPLNRNIYQYLQYFFQIDVRVAGQAEPVRRFRFIFQDASTQAYHNAQGQPWVALSPSATDALLTATIAKAEFKNSPSASTEASEVAKTTKTFVDNYADFDESTFSVNQLSEEVALVSWMTKAPANPYSGYARAFGVLVKQTANGWMVAENLSLASDLLFPMERMATEVGATAGAPEQWAAKLLDLSKE